MTRWIRTFLAVLAAAASVALASGCGPCKPGQCGEGDKCSAPTDCKVGLSCSANGVCVPVKIVK